MGNAKCAEVNVINRAIELGIDGDLMWDPRIDFKVDYENKKVTPISYENSGTGMYEEYDIEHLTPETAEKINDLLEFVDMWLDNIEAQGYDLSAREVPEQAKYNDFTRRSYNNGS